MVPADASGGLGAASSPLAALFGSAVFTLGGIALFLGLVALGRRRRLALAAASVAVDEPVSTSFVATRGVGVAALPPDTPFEEANIPRWRRPSVRAARQVSERDAPIEHVPVLFAAPTRAGEDRREVVYRLVRVGTEQDEFTGEEVARLDRGDEVVVLREEAGYCLVRTPLDAIGWVHRTTLRRFDEGPGFELRLETDG